LLLDIFSTEQPKTLVVDHSELLYEAAEDILRFTSLRLSSSTVKKSESYFRLSWRYRMEGDIFGEI